MTGLVRILAGCGALAAVAAMPLTASALLLDMDQVSTPVYTEPGAESIRPCSYVTGATPNTGCSLFGSPTFGPIGYAEGEEPIGDFRAAPLVPVTLPDLWSDGHRVLAEGATLVLGGLAPGLYQLTVMSHNPVGTTLDTTVFEIPGVDPFTITNVPNPDPGSDLYALQARTVGVVVDASGVLTIHYRSGTLGGAPGVLNGLLLIPEPSTVLLVATGLAVIARRRRA